MAEQEEPKLIVCGAENELLTYQQVSDFVGGFVEVVKLSSGDVLLINEDGIQKKLPINYPATQIYRKELEGKNVAKLPPLEFQRVYKTDFYRILGNAVWVDKKFANRLFLDEVPDKSLH